MVNMQNYYITTTMLRVLTFVLPSFQTIWVLADFGADVLGIVV